MDRAEHIQRILDRQQSDIEELQCEDAGKSVLRESFGKDKKLLTILS
jgi:hypothetical protein